MTRRRVPTAMIVGLLLAALAAVTLAAGTTSGTAAKPKPKKKPKPLCLGKRATKVGTARANTLVGTARADVIAGLAGNDTIDGSGGPDRICGGAGPDKLQGGAGVDVIDGGPGQDVCRGAETTVSCEETRPIPSLGPLAPGEYLADFFLPRFAFRISTPGWSFAAPSAARHMQLEKRKDPGALGLAFDTVSDQESVAVTLARLSSIAGPLKLTGPAAVTVGGFSGERILLTVTGSEIIRLPGVTNDRYELEPNDRAWIHAINVRGKTLTIIIEAQAPEFPAFSAEAEQIVASVSFPR